MRFKRSSLSSARVIRVSDLEVAPGADPSVDPRMDCESRAARVGQHGRLQWPCILRYMTNRPKPTPMRIRLRRVKRIRSDLLAPPRPERSTMRPPRTQKMEDEMRMNFKRFFLPGQQLGGGMYVFLGSDWSTDAVVGW
eukprot:maker-scaffold308_size214241-snap-gene-0.23 protein:Tk09048 transcript:maker-scaffold308_size214241-snap-gene-0.23-mRNA-1 annotation:"probable cyclin-dependent ser thr protein kinase kin28"